MHPSDQQQKSRKIRRRALLVVPLVLLGLLGVGWWQLGRVVRLELEAKRDKLFNGTEFSLTWRGIALSPLGQVDIHQVELRQKDGPKALAEVHAVQIEVSWLKLLTGERRAQAVTFLQPRLSAALTDGKPLNWQRLLEQLRRDKKPSDPNPLGWRKYSESVVIRGGELALTAAGKYALPTTTVKFECALDLAVADNSLTAQLDSALGGGKVTAQVQVAAGKPTAVALRIAPPLRVPAPHDNPSLPQGLIGEVDGMELSADVQAALGVRVRDGKIAVVEIGRLEQRKGEGVLAQDIGLLFGESWLKAVPPEKPELLEEKLGKLPSELRGHIGDAKLLIGLLGTRLEINHAKAHFGDFQGEVGQLAIEVKKFADLKQPQNWRHLDVTAPKLSLPISAAVLQKMPELPEKLQKNALRRQRALAEIARQQAAAKAALEAEDADEDDRAKGVDKHPVEAAAPLPIVNPENTLAERPKHQDVSTEKPATRWTRQLQQGHAKLLELYAKVESIWPFARVSVPEGLRVSVRDGAISVLDVAGKPLIGAAGLRVEIGRVVRDQREFNFGLAPFDALGPLGLIGGQWQRDPLTHEHHIDLHLAGGGLTQLLASKIPGLSVGTQADTNLFASALLRENGTFEVQGRLGMARMGIQWWRLAARPIDDFSVHTTFLLQVGKNSLTLRAPDVELGDAKMVGELEVYQVNEHPKIHLDFHAPMQDCGAMLHAIPPSLLPTVGRIDAHGFMSWQVGLHVPLAAVGATQVDLALGDTLCVLDQFEKIDLNELKGDFDRAVNENGTVLDDVHIGPGSGSWTPVTQIPPNVTYAMWATEDPFYSHRGISEALLEKALGIDLSTGRFVYGGSTITQQLAKNLYLKRTKALSRKFEEMLIVWQMERIVGKPRIVEIYVNGVEFGPKIYGITRAAWAFYSKKPSELRPKEGVYLAIIKPSPRSGWGTMRANGWGDWYNEKVTKYMDKLLRDETITKQQYDEDFPFKPDFNPPGKDTPAPPPTPLPRKVKPSNQAVPAPGEFPNWPKNRPPHKH